MGSRFGIARALRTLTIAWVTLLAMPLHAQMPAPLPPGTVLQVLEDGPVTAQFLGGSAALFDNELYLDSPANALGRIFHNHQTAPFTQVALGTFSAGTELIFRNHVVNTSDDFFTGPAARNPDSLAHAQVTLVTNAQVALFESINSIPANTLLRGNGANPVAFVGFEDLLGGGDLDFNDLTYLFNNVTSAIPEPSQALLFLAGLVLIGAMIPRDRTRSGAALH